MADFMIRFLICNLFISVLVGILLAARHLLRNILSGRMQYHLWFLLLGLLAIPFLPFRLTGFPKNFVPASNIPRLRPVRCRKRYESGKNADSCGRYRLAQ